MCLKFIHVIVRGLSLFLLQVNMPQFFMHFPVNEPLNWFFFKNTYFPENLLVHAWYLG